MTELIETDLASRVPAAPQQVVARAEGRLPSGLGEAMRRAGDAPADKPAKPVSPDLAGERGAAKPGESVPNSAAKPSAKPAEAKLAPAGKSQVGRLVRVAIGLLLLAIGGAFVGDRFWTLRSSAAVLGLAEIVIRAPIEGELHLASLGQGDVVAAGVALGRIATPRQDDWRLTDLRGSLAIAEEEIRALDSRRGSLARLMDETADAARQFMLARQAQLDARIAENAAEELAAVGRLRESAAALSRAEALFAQSAGSLAALEAARRAHAVAQGETGVVVQRGRAVRTEREAAGQGVFLSDNNDQSASRQSLDLLRGRLAELDLQRAGAVARRDALESQIAREAARHARAGVAVVASPVRGRVAVIAARDGEFVRAGQEIAVVQDCSRPLVRAQLGQSTYRALRLGTPARFTRADGQEAAGQVVRLEMPRSATGDLYEATIALAPARRAAADSTEGSPAASVPVEWESSCQAGLLGSMHFQR